ncbi:MAG: hypothetical protein ACOC36_01520 [Fibrobacterota bacterium]
MRAKLFNLLPFLILSLWAATNINAQDPVSEDSLSSERELSQSPPKAVFKPQPYSPNRDMAFVSVMGSRPRESFRGYQKAILYNAKGRVIKEVDISRSDSIYCLDRMIQENRNKGPLFIKIFR